MSQGTIQVITFTLSENLPVANAQVTLSKTYDDGISFTKSFTTDTQGYSQPIAVEASLAKY